MHISLDWKPTYGWISSVTSNEDAAGAVLSAHVSLTGRKQRKEDGEKWVEDEMEGAIVEEIPRGGLLISWEFNKVQQALQLDFRDRNLCVCKQVFSFVLDIFVFWYMCKTMFFFTNVTLQGKKKLHFCLKTTYNAVIFHRRAAAKNREFNYTNVVKYYWRRVFIYSKFTQHHMSNVYICSE